MLRAEAILDGEHVRFCQSCQGFGYDRRRKGSPTCRRCGGTGDEPAAIIVSAPCLCGEGVLLARAFPGDGRRTATVLCPACLGTHYLTNTDGRLEAIDGHWAAVDATP